MTLSGTSSSSLLAARSLPLTLLRRGLACSLVQANLLQTPATPHTAVKTAEKTAVKTAVKTRERSTDSIKSGCTDVKA
jgi:hypothetical protein